MKGISHWSYAPYRPFFFDTGDIYICRIAPGEQSVRVEWLARQNGEYTVFAKKRGEAGGFSEVGRTDGDGFLITGLETDTDYELYVVNGEKKSRVRLARTGKPVGTVVNYLHPDDEAYSFSGRYLCSPSLVRHPDGYLLASMDIYAGRAPQNLTLIFRSDDNGASWHYVSELMPCFWGKLFVHRGILYMLACSTEYGDLLIGRSEDGGKTFCTPAVLLRGSCKSERAGVHKNPQNILLCKGRIYETLEWGAWSEGYHAAMVMSCDESDDLLDPQSWHFTPPVRYDESWPGVAKGKSTGNIEGTLVASPDGRVYNIMRYDMKRTVPQYGLALAYLVDTDNPDAPLSFSHAIEFPANHSKFMIKRDPVTGVYYSVATRITSPETAFHRTLLSLMASDDLKSWRTVADLLDARGKDPKKNGFQYVDFEIEGDDIIYLCRTAINEPDSFHNSNYITFHKIKDFRSLNFDE